MDVIFKGVSVTYQDIIEAMSDFDEQYPDTNDYCSWVDKKNYKYAVQHNDKLYPCKHILSQTTQIDTSEFSGGEQTNSIFLKLGFNVINKL